MSHHKLIREPSYFQQNKTVGVAAIGSWPVSTLDAISVSMAQLTVAVLLVNLVEEVCVL